ncbi:UDP-N-acetylglucosamine 2-epimerase (non-hydrolyzing) [bacterium]|nr:UDP-N-acetylglucosamine 2-epimerase (non-hydrolyzing) [bacterium]
MTEKYKVMVVFGTRPEAIKLIPVILKLKEYSEKIDTFVVVTAQHREMLDQPLKLFNIVPDRDLDIMRDKQSLFDITSKVIKGIEKVILEENPDLMLVQGDTTTTFVSALGSYYLKIPVGHVEAGLRTYNKFNPFPEEMNRSLTGRIADYHFAPTQRAKSALLKEGISEEKIWITGNTVIDALLMTVKKGYDFDDPSLRKVDFAAKKVITLTTHRRESFGSPMEETLKALVDIVNRNKDTEVVFPVHYNPNVRDAVKKVISSSNRIHLIDPLDYEPFVQLLNNSYIVLTDSGGIQEEAPSLGKPVLVLRETTERPEGIEAGTAKLVGTDKDRIIREAELLLNDPYEYDKMARAVNPYGDGKASDRIADIILEIGIKH